MREHEVEKSLPQKRALAESLLRALPDVFVGDIGRTHIEPGVASLSCAKYTMRYYL